MTMYQAKKYFKPNAANGLTFAGWQVVDESGTAVPVIYDQKWEAEEAAMSINCELGLESDPLDMRSESEILTELRTVKPIGPYTQGYCEALRWVLKM